MGLLLVLGLTACGPPVDYRHPGEVPGGPGIVTGEKGAVRFGGGDPGDGRDERATGAGPQAAAAGAGGDSAGSCDCIADGELEAYRAFLRWKARSIGTPEYREFQDWRAWRRERRAAD